MLGPILTILSLLAVASAVWLLTRRSGNAAKAARAAEARRRYAVQDTGERVPLAIDRRTPAAAAPVAEIAPVSNPLRRPGAAPDPDAPPLSDAPVGEGAVTGRLVNTPDGEMILTTPPFALREAIFTGRSGRFVNLLMRRVPAWVVVCPKVRLDTLVTPTRPDGRDPADWREWRRRVRLRSVDLLLCDRRTWRPVLAILFDARAVPDARRIAGGQDRMADEVLHAVGLPLLRLTGDFERDWPVIKPHVDDLILPHVDDERVLDAGFAPARIDEGGAVNLLRMDDSRGGLLE